MFDFEKLHPNQTCAFIDGLLCGVVVTIMVTKAVKDYRHTKIQKARMKAEAAIENTYDPTPTEK